MEKSMSLGEIIKYYRKKLGKTQRELSKITGLSYVSISDYENNKTYPHLGNLKKLAQALDIPLEELTLSNKNPKIKEEADYKKIFKDLLMDLSVEIPVYGTIPAGKPQESGDDILGKIKFPSELARTVDYALRVKGLSMIEGGIVEGSLVFVKKQNYADDGDVVIARKNNEYTIKKFRRTLTETWLEPANKDFVFGKSEFEIIGVVKYVLKILKE